MQVYKSESREILLRYKAGQITYPECVAALDAAAAALIPFLKAEDFPEAASLICADKETLAEETRCRAGRPEASVNSPLNSRNNLT